MASQLDSPGTPSRLVTGRYPPPGSDPVADRIRARRGARGLTPLDANLLHLPAMAGGYNDLLGSLRTGGQLPGDIRELMVRSIYPSVSIYCSSSHRFCESQRSTTRHSNGSNTRRLAEQRASRQASSTLSEMSILPSLLLGECSRPSRQSHSSLRTQ